MMISFFLRLTDQTGKPDSRSEPLQLQDDTIVYHVDNNIRAVKLMFTLRNGA